MVLNKHAVVLLAISISSLILSFCTAATDLGPSPAPAPAPTSSPVSYISSSPASSSSPVSYISSSSAPSSWAPISYISSSPDTSPASAPSPSPEGNSDVASIVGSYLKKGTTDAELAIDFIAKLVKDNPSVTPVEGECYEQCMENYGGISDDFKKAQEDLSSGDLYLLSENLSEISGDIDACQECFKERVGVDVSPLAKFDESLEKAAEDSLNILQYTS